jgi:hypothetical protein
VAEPGRYRASPRWLATAAGGLVFLTDTETGDIQELNATGRMVYEAAAAGASLPEAAALLAQRFPGVPRAEAERDAGELVAELLRRGALGPR